MALATAFTLFDRWPAAAVYALGAGVLLVGALLGYLIDRWRDHRSIAQRLTALASRLGVEPRSDSGRVEAALAYLEEVTGAATTVVSESSAESLRLRRSLDSLPLGLILVDEGGEVVFRNHQAETLMASRYGEAIAAQAVTDSLAEAWNAGVAEQTVDIYGPPRRTLLVRAAIIDDGRRPLGVLAVIEDTSERRRLEEIRRDFIANVSHELKTPMGALGLLAETLQYEQDAAVARRLAERINVEAFRVNRIIEDLLDLSRIESEGSPAREPLPVALFVAEAIERIRTAADQRDVAVVFDEPEGAPVVAGDRRQLVSAVHALLENAVVYSPVGSLVRIAVTRREPGLDDGGETTPACVCISVTDQGIGIPAKDLERIFERFYRVDPGRARETGGTGLGLSIVRHVAHNHGGTVTVNSREGEGSTFTLELPVGGA